jgi:ABC-type transporter Mla MlaB component
MLRIRTVAESSSQVTLGIEGRVVSEWVALLERECRLVLQQNRRVRLDLSAVQFIDGRGVAALRRLGRKDVEIINCQEFIEELLRRGDEG